MRVAPAGTPESKLTPSGRFSAVGLKHTKPMRRWHEAIIDDMLAMPFSTIRERAARLNYSEHSMGMIMRSDMFVAAYEARRAQYSELLNAALAQKLAKTGDKLLDTLNETLDAKRTQIPFQVLAETTVSVLEKLGFGTRPGGGVQVNVNQSGNGPMGVAISAERLQGARDKLRAAEVNKSVPSGAPLALPPEGGLTDTLALEGEVLPPNVGGS